MIQNLIGQISIYNDFKPKHHQCIHKNQIIQKNWNLTDQISNYNDFEPKHHQCTRKKKLKSDPKSYESN